jgi:hypothetical protein
LNDKAGGDTVVGTGGNTDKERMDWLERNASNMGFKADCRWFKVTGTYEAEKLGEFTDIRKRIDKLMEND